MTHNAQFESVPFLEVLLHDFGSDPEVLYTATHAFSDLSLTTSQTLAREAPFSYQVHLLNAEALEIQGKWDEAATILLSKVRNANLFKYRRRGTQGPRYPFGHRSPTRSTRPECANLGSLLAALAGGFGLNPKDRKATGV